MTNYSLRARMMILILAPTVLIGLLLSIFFVVHRYNDLQRQLEDAGASIIEPLAVSTEYGMSLQNRESIGQLISVLHRRHSDTALRQGWQEGRQNADLTLEANQKTLTRDYRGMMLYSLLWRQGMITRPDVSDQMQTVTGDGKKLVTGDRVRRLKNHAEFNLQKSHWRPLIGTEGGSR